MGVRTPDTKTGGRPATQGVIEGSYSLSVGHPKKEAPNGWKWTLLTDISRLESGHTPSRKHPEYWDGDTPWIGIKDATSNHGTTIYDTFQHTNALGIANSSARVLPINTVCLSRTASVGYVIVMGKEMATSQDFVNWVCDPNFLHFQFLKYVLLAENRSFLMFAHGTTHQTIYFPEVKAFHICLPPLSEQRAIAHILGSLDDKIELNRQMNATLEAMAQALFQSWFVDFDPVIDKALAAGHDIPEPLQAKARRRAALGDRRKALPTEVLDLFPDQFVETEEMGWVPEGWGTTSFSEHLEVVRGFSYKGEGLREIDLGTPMYNLNSVYEGGGLKYHGTKYYEGDYKEKHTVKSRDILVANTEQGHKYLLIGCPAVIPHHFSGQAIFSHHIYRVRPLELSPVSPHYAYYTFLNPRIREKIIGYCNGTTVNMLKIDGLQKPNFLIASKDAIQQFSNQVEHLWQRKECLHLENSTLTQLRDTLLPKLISGELRLGAV